MNERPSLPHAYRTIDPAQRTGQCDALPRNVFIEVTNRCNLLCTTCPRTFAPDEPEHDLSLHDLIVIAEAFPDLERVVLHGIGEPLLNPELVPMIRYLKSRQVTVLFNSNGTLLDERLWAPLAESGLDEFRLSLDAACPDTYQLIRGRPLFERVVENLQGFVETCARVGVGAPRISIWCMALRDNIEELPDLIRLAARLGVPEVYLQRLTYDVDPETRHGLAGPEHALYHNLEARERALVGECEALSRELGIRFQASGATTPADSLQGSAPGDAMPWSACLRPWTTAYVTANGNVLPCCIAPFSATCYGDLIMGNVWRSGFPDIWNGDRYRHWREALLSTSPEQACSGCGVMWSL